MQAAMRGVWDLEFVRPKYSTSPSHVGIWWGGTWRVHGKTACWKRWIWDLMVWIWDLMVWIWWPMVRTLDPGTLDLQEQFGKINVQEAGIEPLPLHTTIITRYFYQLNWNVYLLVQEVLIKIFQDKIIESEKRRSPSSSRLLRYSHLQNLQKQTILDS